MTVRPVAAFGDELGDFVGDLGAHACCRACFLLVLAAFWGGIQHSRWGIGINNKNIHYTQSYLKHH